MASGTTTDDEDLITRHFVAQRLRPPGVGEIALREMAPAQRILLFHDGTLTTALEAMRLGSVVVDVRFQDEARLDADPAHWLGVPPRTVAVRRHVTIREPRAGELLADAESWVLFDRLPPAFAHVLARAGKGLGTTLRWLTLESRRELLWCGRTTIPPVPGDPRPRPAVSRCYRLFVGGLPVACVEECFPLGAPIKEGDR